MENNYQTFKNSDFISNLPTDKEIPTSSELQIINTLFKNKKSVNSIFIEAKESIIIGILFVIFSIPQVDNLIENFLPITTKLSYLTLIIKVLFIMLIFWVIKHFYLNKKN